MAACTFRSGELFELHMLPRGVVRFESLGVQTTFNTRHRARDLRSSLADARMGR